jgi:hypothetical protein
MASNGVLNGQPSASASITLTEEDIPGALLLEPYEGHTLEELRWWLLCHGVTVPTSMKKAKVVERWVYTSHFYYYSFT